MGKHYGPLLWNGAWTEAFGGNADPAFVSNAKELVFVRGSINPVAAHEDLNEYTNSPRRESNMWWDPEAASAVLHETWRSQDCVELNTAPPHGAVWWTTHIHSYS